MHVVDDERHLVFECLAFEGIRAARRHLFSADVGGDMKAFMAQRDQKGVLWFVMACLKVLDRPAVQELPDVDPVDLGVDVPLDTYDD